MLIKLDKYKIALSFITYGVISVVCWSLNKGLVFSDEAFFLFHLDETAKTIDLSKWHLFARPFFDKHTIIYNRYVIVILMIGSNLMLAISFKRFFSNISFISVLCVLLIGQFATTTPVCYSPNYLNFNQIAFNFLIASFFLHWRDKSLLILVLIGFLLFYMMLNIPTSASVIIPFFIVGFFENKRNIKILFNHILLIGAGFLIATILYFIMIESFHDFINNFKDAVSYLEHDPKHNSYGLLKWHAKLFIYFAPVIIHFLLLQLNFKKITSNIIYRSILILWGIAALYYAVTNGNYNFTLTPVYLLLIHIIYNIKSENKIYLYFLLSVPYFASLGSDVNFIYRSSYYAGFVFFVSILIFLKSNLKYRVALIAVFLLIITNYFTYPFRKNWGGYKIVNQNTIYNKGGYHLLLDATRAERLNKIYSLLENKNVILAHQSLYGYALLTNAKVKYLNFRFSDYALGKNLDLSYSSVLITLNSKKVDAGIEYKRTLYTDEEITIYQL